MNRRAWTLFAAVCLLWGIPYVFIKIAVEELSPTMLAFVRVALGCAVLLPYALHKRAFRGLRARMRPLLAYTAVELAIAWPLIGFGQQRISSSLTAILLAAVPLILAVIALRFDSEERSRGGRLVGLVLGFAGVIALLGLDVSQRPGELLGAGAILAAATCYAVGPLIIKHRLADVDPLGAVTASFGLAALMLAPAALLTVPPAFPSTDVVLSVAVLGIACSAAAFLCFFALIAAIGPARASVITYVLPIIAVALGAGFLDERLAPSAAAGLLLILAGSWLATGGHVPFRRRASAGAVPASSK